MPSLARGEVGWTRFPQLTAGWEERTTVLALEQIQTERT
jgi:hypothetical protein